jgi:acyl-CoA thioester hydrolase
MRFIICEHHTMDNYPLRRHASRFRDRLIVRASLVEWETRLVINYLVTDAATNERVARAQTSQVVVNMPAGTLRFELPRQFVALVESAIAADEAS